MFKFIINNIFFVVVCLFFCVGGALPQLHVQVWYMGKPVEALSGYIAANEMIALASAQLKHRSYVDRSNTVKTDAKWF